MYVLVCLNNGKTGEEAMRSDHVPVERPIRLLVCTRVRPDLEVLQNRISL